MYERQVVPVSERLHAMLLYCGQNKTFSLVETDLP